MSLTVQLALTAALVGAVGAGFIWRQVRVFDREFPPNSPSTQSDKSTAA